MHPHNKVTLIVVEWIRWHSWPNHPNPFTCIYTSYQWNRCNWVLVLSIVIASLEIPKAIVFMTLNYCHLQGPCHKCQAWTVAAKDVKPAYFLQWASRTKISFSVTKHTLPREASTDVVKWLLHATEKPGFSSPSFFWTIDEIWSQNIKVVSPCSLTTGLDELRLVRFPSMSSQTFSFIIHTV